MKISWKLIAPIIVAIVLALLPAPAGLTLNAWRYFAIFAGVIVGLVLEPLPGAVIGLIGVTLIAALARFTLFTPQQLGTAGFDPVAQSVSWALAGFSNGTVWLIFGAFMFALGYEKTGLGKRIGLLLVKALGSRTLRLGYAVMFADLVLAPFTPSNTARSGGTIFPIIRNLPPLYGSKPNDPSARKLGGYLMWTALAVTCITSSLFLTGLAPNLLAQSLIRQGTQVDINWTRWFLGFLPVGAILLALTPLITYLVYPPEIKVSPEVPEWAGQQLAEMGPITRREIIMAVLVLIALALWIVGSSWIDATVVALTVICGMLIFRVVSWDDMLGNKQAWNTLAWFGTLVTLASGLNTVGFIKWFGGLVGGALSGMSVVVALVVLVAVFFIVHYMFASLTAHTTALLPVMLAAGATVAGMPAPIMAVLLAYCLGLMGILTPYATGPSPVYYGSGYIKSGDFWRLGAIFGAVFLLVLLVVGVPWNLYVIR